MMEQKTGIFVMKRTLEEVHTREAATAGATSSSPSSTGGPHRPWKAGQIVIGGFDESGSRSWRGSSRTSCPQTCRRSGRRHTPVADEIAKVRFSSELNAATAAFMHRAIHPTKWVVVERHPEAAGDAPRGQGLVKRRARPAGQEAPCRHPCSHHHLQFVVVG